MDDTRDPWFWNLGGWVFLLAGSMFLIEGHEVVSFFVLLVGGALFWISLWKYHHND